MEIQLSTIRRSIPPCQLRGVRYLQHFTGTMPACQLHLPRLYPLNGWMNERTHSLPVIYLSPIPVVLLISNQTTRNCCLLFLDGGSFLSFRTGQRRWRRPTSCCEPYYKIPDVIMNFLSVGCIKQGRNNLVKNEEMWSREDITSRRDADYSEQTARNEGHLDVNECDAAAGVGERHWPCATVEIITLSPHPSVIVRVFVH